MVALKGTMVEARGLLVTRPSEAVAMLEQARQHAGEVPPAFELLVAQAYAAAGLQSRALDVLQACYDSGRATPEIKVALGNALRHSGRREEAAKHYNSALEETIQEKPKNNRDLLPNSVAYDSGNKALLVYVPKVACTILKATVVMNSPLKDNYEASGLGIHRFVGSTTPTDEIERLMVDSSVFRWTVLRDPARRLLSAYLNKIAGNGKNAANPFYKMRAIKDAQAVAGLPFDLDRSITFEEFVRYLSVTDDRDLNVHWLPQSSIVGCDLAPFSHVGRLENLEATFCLLKTRFDYEPVRNPLLHLGTSKHHSTRYSPTAWLSEPFRHLPSKLRSKTGFPLAESFFTDEIQSLIAERYSDDTRLYRSIAA